METTSLTIFSLSFLTPVYSVYSLVLTTGTVVERSIRIRYRHRILTKKFPCVKAMNWEGKTATCSVIWGFVKATPVVERCTQQPLCISRLVIAPKFAPGQEKSDPDHGYKYYLGVDGFSAYWSID